MSGPREGLRRFVLEFDGDVRSEYRSIAWSPGAGRVCVLQDAVGPEAAQRICSLTLAGEVTIEVFDGNLVDFCTLRGLSDPSMMGPEALMGSPAR